MGIDTKIPVYYITAYNYKEILGIIVVYFNAYRTEGIVMRTRILR
jgi:hypothetical protein